MQKYETLCNQYYSSFTKLATVISNNAGLIEVEINDEDLGFHSIIEELSTEIEAGIIGVKASNLCKRLGIQMVDINEEN